MNRLFPIQTQKDITQSRLFSLAALFLFILSVSITLSSSVRHHTWQTTYHWLHWSGFFIWLLGFSVIHRLSSLYLKLRDPYLLPVVALITGWGLLSIWRLDNNLGVKQTIWLALCLLILAAGIRNHNLMEFLRRHKAIWLANGLILVLLTFFYGTYPLGDGPHLWLKILGIYLQPSEPLKLLLVIYLAAYLADNLPAGFSLGKVIFPTALVVAVAVMLLVFQRDLGTSYIVMVIYCSIIYIASGKKRILLLFVLAIVLASLIGIQIFDVIRLRVESWINPWADPSNRSFQIIQSITAVASGGIFGLGPGMGNPGLVPLSHSDFIFTTISEEYGLIGTVALILMFLILASRGMRIALSTENSYHRYLAAGLTILLISQSILIIGGNLRMLPLTGVTLPFVSYGGSSLVTSYFCCLLLLLASNSSSSSSGINTPQTYTLSFAFLGTSLIMLCLFNGWWSLIRSEDLLDTVYNARPSISSRYVKRGDVLFRNGKKITTSIGAPGELELISLYPALNPVIGYTLPYYGETGLLASLSPWLRGKTGYPSQDIFFHQLLYSQPPPGLDVRTSIDPVMQQKTDDLLADQPGAVILMDAITGEILVMASHPYFDVNQLDQYQDSQSLSGDAPLLNRITQGQYPPGITLAPFILAETFDRQISQRPIDSSADDFSQLTSLCSREEYNKSYSQDCIDIIQSMALLIEREEFIKLLQELEFDSVPDTPLPSVPASNLENAGSTLDELLGKGNSTLLLTPLQMATAAAALTENGRIPDTRITLDYRDSTNEWVPFSSSGTSQQIISLDAIHLAADRLKNPVLPVWDIDGQAEHSLGNRISWYVAGTLPGQSKTSYSLVVVLEKGDINEARSIGEKFLSFALQP